MSITDTLIAVFGEGNIGGGVRGRRWWRHLKQGSVSGCHRGYGLSTYRHVSHDRAVPDLELCYSGDLPAKKIGSVGGEIMWPRFPNVPATVSSVCELCRLTTRFTLSPPVEQIVFVFPEIVFLNLVSARFHCVETCGDGAITWMMNTWRYRGANEQIWDGKWENDDSL